MFGAAVVFIASRVLGALTHEDDPFSSPSDKAIKEEAVGWRMLERNCPARPTLWLFAFLRPSLLLNATFASPLSLHLTFEDAAVFDSANLLVASSRNKAARRALVCADRATRRWAARQSFNSVVL